MGTWKSNSSRSPLIWLTAFLGMLVWIVAASAEFRPEGTLPGMKITLFAEEPMVVTPLSIQPWTENSFLVLCNHTHQRRPDYRGPEHDEIWRIRDTDGDGVADERVLFFEGGRASTSMRVGKDGWVYVARRSEVVRLRDSSGDGRADISERLLFLETEATYPHNGLAGLAWDRSGNLLVGMGENFGKAFVLRGPDQREERGEGDGGFVFRCRADGTGLEKVAEGLWNPFGLCVDEGNRIFAGDNDPDAAPPNRLLHIVEGGDYGFTFRYGRAGTHALQAWNGELPGTLGMAAPLGEAACELIYVDHPAAPAFLKGKLLNASWGDHLIEACTLIPHGSSFRASVDLLVRGPADFRPVGMTWADDGALYVTDWMSGSYAVHGRGRVWRITFDTPSATPTARSVALQTEPQLTAQSLRTSNPPSTTWPNLRQHLIDADAFLVQAVQQALIRSTHDLPGWQEARTPVEREVLTLAAWRRALPHERHLLDHALADPSPRVRLAALRWLDRIDHPDKSSLLDSLLTDGSITPDLLKAVLSMMGNEREARNRLEEFVRDPARPPALRRTAFLTLGSRDPAARLSLARLLVDAGRGDAGRADSLFDDSLRVLAFAGSEEDIPRLQSARSLAELPKAFREDAAFGLQRLAPSPATTPMAPALDNHPPIDDSSAWLAILPAQGDRNAGRRLFHDRERLACALCHRAEGLGGLVGPDLTDIGRRVSALSIMSSLLRPQEDVAPAYAPWLLQWKNGETQLGINAGLQVGPSSMSLYRFADGTERKVDDSALIRRDRMTGTLMPPTALPTLTPQEIADLLAFLSAHPDHHEE